MVFYKKLNMKKKLHQLLVFAFFVFSIFSYSHEPNQSYLFLRIYEADGIQGRFEINVKELNKVFGFNLPDNSTVEDAKPYINTIKTYILENSSFHSGNTKYELILTDLGITETGMGNYIKYQFKLKDSEEIPDKLDIYYNLAFHKDPKHKGFLVMEYNWKAGVIDGYTNIIEDFGPDDTSTTLALDESSVFTGFMAMVKQGVWHIWIGLDHILFLLALILPAVVRRKNNSIFGWEPVMTFKAAFFYIIKVVSFFTIAHTITLTLASLNLINLPSQIVESIIAFSIGLAAYHNIRPIFKMKDWVIAFIFGLFHGFGFASVLGDLGLTGEFLTLSLLGFNIGVEVGQLVIIAAIFPILYVFRNHKSYPKFLVYMSILLIIVSLYWFVERVFDINLKVDDYLFQFVYETAKWLGLK